MKILRQRTYADLVDLATRPASSIVKEEREKRGEEEPSTAKKVASGLALAAGVAFAGHRGYLGSGMMKLTNRGLYNVGSAVGSKTLMNKGAQGYLAGSLKAEGVLTGKGAREFYKTGTKGINDRVSSTDYNMSAFVKEGHTNENQLAAFNKTNETLGLGGEGQLGKLNENSLGTLAGAHGTAKESSLMNNKLGVDSNVSLNSDQNGISFKDSSGNLLGTKTQNADGTFKYNPVDNTTTPPANTNTTT